jgi:hypothetical protein
VDFQDVADLQRSQQLHEEALAINCTRASSQARTVVGSAASESVGGPEARSTFFFFLGFASAEAKTKTAMTTANARPNKKLLRGIIIYPF